MQNSPAYNDGESSTVELSSSALAELKVNNIMLAPSATNRNMRMHIDAPTCIPDLKSPDNVWQSPEQALSESAIQSQPVEIDPAMQAYVNRHSDNRFKKKVVFNREDYDDLLGQIIN